MTRPAKNKWYAQGLHFECQQCGNCCSGPGEGYIWINRKETQLIADYLDMSVEEFKDKCTKRVGFRRSIIETPGNKNCIFLNGEKGCNIYPVRPSQCRNWPFWPENLKSPDTWNLAAQKCPGVNKGRLYTFEEIEQLKNRKKWWEDER